MSPDNGRCRDAPHGAVLPPKIRPANQSRNSVSLRRFRDGKRDD
jgi:hypothetical protein